MANLAIGAKIDNFAKANLKELKAAEQQSGKVWTQQDVLEYMIKNGKASQADMNEFFRSGQSGKSWAASVSFGTAKQASYLDQFSIDTNGILAGGGTISKLGAPVVASARQNNMNKSAREHKNVSDALYNTLKQARNIIAGYLKNPDVINQISQNGHYVAEQFGFGTSAESVLKKLDDMLLLATEMKSTFNDKQFAKLFAQVSGGSYDAAAVEKFSNLVDSNSTKSKIGLGGMIDPKEYTAAFEGVFGPEITNIVKNTANFVQHRKDNALRDAVGTAIGYFAAAAAAVGVGEAVAGAAAGSGAAAGASGTTATVVKMAATAGTAALAAACQEDDINVTINIDTKALAEAMAKEVDRIVNKLDEAINHLTSIGVDVKAIRDKDYSGQLEEICNQIKALKGDQVTAEDFNAQIQKLLILLSAINDEVGLSVEIQDNTYKTIQDLYTLINDTSKSVEEKLDLIKELLAKIDITTSDIKDNTDTIIGKLDRLIELSESEQEKLNKIIEQNDKAYELSEKIYAMLEKMPAEIRAQFSEDFKAILLKMDNNNAKLDAMLKFMKVLDKHMRNGFVATNINLFNILGKLDKIDKHLDSLYNKLIQKFGDFENKITAALDAMATAIANLAAKVENIDLSKIEKTLEDILDKIGANEQKLNEFKDLLVQINDNTILNGQRQEKIINLINELGPNITSYLKTIIDKIGNDPVDIDKIIKAMEALAKSNREAIENLDSHTQSSISEMNKQNEIRNEKVMKALATIIELLKKEPNLNINLDDVIMAINMNGDAIIARLDFIQGTLGCINQNITNGRNEVNVMLGKILNALKNMAPSKDYTALLEQIVAGINKLVKPEDLARIEAKLQAILEAIRDHKVLVEVNTDGSCSCKPNPECTPAEQQEVNEGVIGDIEWLVGLAG